MTNRINEKTTVVNISKAALQQQGYSDLTHWLENPDHIYVGRAVRYVTGAKKSKWANPFSKKKYGHQRCVEMYEEYIRNQPELLADISELKNKVLGCWCKPGPCHGDILARLADAANDK
ncbi:MAG: DUF4326 domain-containing protein [Saprospiraceae bacterium]|nr:DUF4326 domain-containing protein [Saprospiraceae bacterium]